MINADELDGEVEAEVTEECENYGSVRKERITLHSPGRTLVLHTNFC